MLRIKWFLLIAILSFKANAECMSYGSSIDCSGVGYYPSSYGGSSYGGYDPYSAAYSAGGYSMMGLMGSGLYPSSYGGSYPSYGSSYGNPSTYPTYGGQYSPYTMYGYGGYTGQPSLSGSYSGYGGYGGYSGYGGYGGYSGYSSYGYTLPPIYNNINIVLDLSAYQSYCPSCCSSNNNYTYPTNYYPTTPTPVVTSGTVNYPGLPAAPVTTCGASWNPCPAGPPVRDPVNDPNLNPIGQTPIRYTDPRSSHMVY